MVAVVYAAGQFAPAAAEVGRIRAEAAETQLQVRECERRALKLEHLWTLPESPILDRPQITPRLYLTPTQAAKELPSLE